MCLLPSMGTYMSHNEGPHMNNALNNLRSRYPPQAPTTRLELFIRIRGAEQEDNCSEHEDIDDDVIVKIIPMPVELSKCNYNKDGILVYNRCEAQYISNNTHNKRTGRSSVNNITFYFAKQQQSRNQRFPHIKANRNGYSRVCETRCNVNSYRSHL